MALTSKNSYHNDALNCLYQALIKLLEVKPFRKITKTEIIQKAGVSHMSFYRHYKKKEDILFERLRMHLEHLEQNYRVLAKPDRLKFWTMFYEFHRTDPILSYLIQAGYITECLQETYQFFVRNCELICHSESTCSSNEIKFFFELGGIIGQLAYIQKYAESVDCEKAAINTINFIDSLSNLNVEACLTEPQETRVCNCNAQQH